MSRRVAPLGWAAALWLALGGATLAADAARPLAGQTVTVIEPFGRGSVTETVMRLLKPGMERALGARVVVETVRSPDGGLAFERVAHARADGHTLLAITDATRLFLEHLSASPQKLESMTAVAKLTDGVSLALATAADSPVADYAALARSMKAKNRPSLTLYGADSPAGVFAAIIEDDVGTRFGQRTYQVDSEIIDDLRTHRVAFGVLPTTALVGPAGKANRLRGLLTSGAQRHPQLADVPTLGEATGKKKLTFTVAVGLFGPPGMTDTLTAALFAAAQAAVQDEKAQAEARQAALPLAVNDGAVLREAMERTHRVIRDLLAP